MQVILIILTIRNFILSEIPNFDQISQMVELLSKGFSSMELLENSPKKFQIPHRIINLLLVHHTDQ